MAIKTFTTGEVLTAADTNTYLNNGGLVYITQTSATSGPSLVIDNCFSSTYNNYRILIDNFQPSIASQNLSLRMRVGGSNAEGPDYYWGLSGVYADATSSTSAGKDQTALQTGLFNSANNLALGSSTIDVFAPNRAERTYFNINSCLYNGQFGARVGFGEHNATTAYTGFTLFAGAGNFSNIRVWIYGYRIS